MPHYYIKPDNISETGFVLYGDEAHHLIDVMRVKINDELNLFDGAGNSYHVRIESISRGEISGVILSKEQTCKSKIKITVYQAIPKGERLDWLVEKLSELGVTGLFPIITKRCVVKNVSDLKLKRWQRLSLAASKQCGRADVLEIHPPVPFDAAAKKIEKYSLNIIPWEGATENMKFDAKAPLEANIFIGPEGGFTFDEIELAKENCIIPVTLGQRILRIETASLLASILVLNAFNEFKL
ncbi:MAG: 16S rRNA (uracil(1498)-N(3))-methyltransferase [Elusimicrobia bacterium]|nr:16S rRNA (uracil(1498)-N(3))-methyltransferase [Candidatus Liberimonas magnetica]